MSSKFLEHFPARGVRVFGKGIVIGNVMMLTFAKGSGTRVSILQENRNGRWHSVDAPQVVRLQARPRSSVGPERWSYEPQVAGSSPAGTSFSFLRFYLPLHDDTLPTGVRTMLLLGIFSTEHACHRSAAAPMHLSHL